VLGVVGQQPVSKVEQLLDALIRDSVVDDPPLALRLDEAAPAQARKVARDLRLREPKARDEFSNRQLALLAKKLEDLHPRRVAKSPEVLGDEVGRDWRLRKPKRHCPHYMYAFR